MKKKRQFHCNECNSACEMYKKGKKHRVLICPKCGVIASNPLPLAALAASAIPAVIDMVSKKGDKSTKKGGESAIGGGVQKIIYDNKDKPNKSERYVEMALRGV